MADKLDEWGAVVKHQQEQYQREQELMGNMKKQRALEYRQELIKEMEEKTNKHRFDRQRKDEEMN